MAAELGRYLNIDSSTFSKTSTELCVPDDAVPAPTVHEQALSAILEVVTANSNASIAVRPHCPHPKEGFRSGGRA